MNIFTRLIGRLKTMIFADNDIGREFGVEILSSKKMTDSINLWNAVSTGNAPWINSDDDVISINMAKHIADTRAKLTTLDIGVAISSKNEEHPRIIKLQQMLDDLMARLPEKMSDADRLGGMMIKYNGESWDYILPTDFAITSCSSNGEINGAIFASAAHNGDDHYTRLEYHHFEGDKYIIENKAYKNTKTYSGKTSLGKKVPLTDIDDWANIEPVVEIDNLQKPLFAYYRVPGSNTIDASPNGLSVFANAIEELKAVDVAISRKNAEVEDSKHITFVGQSAIKNAQNKGITLPRFVRGLGMGINDGETSAIHEHKASMLTEERIKDLNFDLSLLGVKCGFSEGVFVMDGQSGMITATQIESDDRDTVQTIKAERDALKNAIKDAVCGADALITLYDLAPLGNGYELNFNFGDITYSYEEDKASWKQYVREGLVPAWKYFVKFEGMTEDEAKEMTAEARNGSREVGLFEE